MHYPLPKRIRALFPLLAAGMCGMVAMAQQPTTAVKAPPTTAAAGAQAGNPVVVTVGTEMIHADLFNALIAAASPEAQQQMQANKLEVAQELGKMLALAQEAQRRGIDHKPDIAAELLVDRGNVLAHELETELQGQSKPTPAQVQAYFQAHPNDFVQLKVRHILVGDSETPGSSPNPRTQAEALAKAQQLETRLKTEDFAAVAKSDSDDKGSGAQGGELGVVKPGETVPEFEQAVWALPVGKTSDPIHTRFGYHIVQVEARTNMTLAEATPLVEDKLETDAVTQAMDRITGAAKITINNAYFGAPAGH